MGGVTFFILKLPIVDVVGYQLCDLLLQGVVNGKNLRLAEKPGPLFENPRPRFELF